jgi:hypothetical protein
VLVTFSYWEKTPEQINLKEERFSLAYGFRAFSAGTLGSIVFRRVAKQKHHGRRGW